MGAKLTIDMPDSELREIEVETGFSRSQIIRLCNRFATLSKAEDKKSLSRADLLAIPEIAVNPLGERIVSAFFPSEEDVEDNREEDAIDVRQFLRTLSCFRPVKAGHQRSDKDVEVDCSDGPPNSRDAKLRFAFRMYDTNNDGNITQDELLSLLSMMVGSNIGEEQLLSIAERTLAEADLDQDNMISFNEFKEIMTKVDIEQRMSIRFLSWELRQSDVLIGTL